MPSNRKSRAAEQRRLPEPSDKTVIIPQITPELLEQRRREAVRRSQTITRSTPPAPQPAPWQQTLPVPPEQSASPVMPAPPADTGTLNPSAVSSRRIRRRMQEQATQPGTAPPLPETPPAAEPQPAAAPEDSMTRTLHIPALKKRGKTEKKARTAPTAPSAPQQAAPHQAAPAASAVPAASAAPQTQAPARPAAQPAAAPEKPAVKSAAPKQTEERRVPRTRAEAEAALDSKLIHDHIWLNNCVMVRGMGLAAVVAAANRLDNALMLAAAALLLITSTRVAAEAVLHLTGNRGRTLVYCLSAAVCYLPCYLVLYAVFGANLSVLGIYLPLLVVDPATIKRMEFDDLEPLGRALRLGLNNALGVASATLLVGALRELLAAGTLLGRPILHRAILPVAGQIGGGFLVVGLLAALWNGVRDQYVTYKRQEVKRLYGKRSER